MDNSSNIAYTVQLGDLRSDSGIKDVSGVCHDSTKFADQVNAVTRRLMRRGTWWNTDVLMRVCFQGCRLVFPRIVGTVLGARFCGDNGMQVKNNWWAIAGYSTRGWDNYSTVGAAPVLRDDGTSPCYNEVTGNTGKYIKYHITSANDVGKTIKLFGFKYGNQPLQELDSDGNWQMGLTLTATLAGVQTTTLVTKITSVVREATQQRAFMYEVDPSTGDLHDLAMYEPSETNPSYRAMVIQNVCAIPYYTDDDDQKIRKALTLVKLQYVPAVSDNDFVMIGNRDAIELGIAALRAERANDDVLANIKWMRAISELNMELRDKDPNLASVIRVNSISANCPIGNPI